MREESWSPERERAGNGRALADLEAPKTLQGTLECSDAGVECAATQASPALMMYLRLWRLFECTCRRRTACLRCILQVMAPLADVVIALNLEPSEPHCKLMTWWPFSIRNAGGEHRNCSSQQTKGKRGTKVGEVPGEVRGGIRSSRVV